MATSRTMLADWKVFSDDVFTSTDLNRRSGEVLNHARTNPVTISRNNEQFALLPREQAARLMKAVSQMESVIELFKALVSVKQKQKPPEEFGWVQAFDEEDQLAMLGEVFGAVTAAKLGGDWDVGVANVLHEWHESALAVMSGVLNAAMQSAPDEQPLTDPRQVGPEETEYSVI